MLGIDGENLNDSCGAGDGGVRGQLIFLLRHSITPLLQTPTPNSDCRRPQAAFSNTNKLFLRL
jgi:hypothetical protein